MVTAPRQHGFTLFEVLIVIAIIGAVAAVMAPMVFRGFSGTQGRAAAYEIAAALRQARGEAIAENADVAVLFAPERNAYGIDGAKPKVLAANLRLALYAAQAGQVGAGTGGIRFFPDGSATGGQVSVDDGTTRYNVDVDWLSGHVSVAAATP